MSMTKEVSATMNLSRCVRVLVLEKSLSEKKNINLYFQIRRLFDELISVIFYCLRIRIEGDLKKLFSVLAGYPIKILKNI